MAFPQSLVEFTTDFTDFQGSENAINTMKLSILDWTAVAMNGHTESVSKMVFKMIANECGQPESFIFGSNVKFPARSAALINGVASHALDYDDTNFLYLGHPSVVVNSAVFAVANMVDLSLKETIECCLIGCEVATRVGIWLGKGHYNKGFHITSTAGIFGAAMGSSRALSLSQDATKNALNLATSKASGLKIQFGTMGKPYHAGMASSSGVEVALLASHGLKACENAFDGNYGFAAVYGGNGVGLEDIFSGSDFLFENVKYKFHACCHGTHAAIEALAFLKNYYQLERKEIENIVISVHQKFATVCNILEPKSGSEIKFSYRMIAAMQMFDFDTANLESFSDKYCVDDNLIEFRKRVTVKFQNNLKDGQAIVEVFLYSGKSHSKKIDLENPTNINKLQARVRKKAETLVGLPVAKKIWAMLQNKQISSNSFMQFLTSYF